MSLLPTLSALLFSTSVCLCVCVGAAYMDDGSIGEKVRKMECVFEGMRRATQSVSTYICTWAPEL